MTKCGPETEPWGITLDDFRFYMNLWMTDTDDAEQMEEEELKWERKIGLSWNKMIKG